MSDFISFSRHTCTLHCLHRAKIPWASHDFGAVLHTQTHTRNGHANEKEKNERRKKWSLSIFAFCILLLNAYNYFVYICLRHTKQRMKGKCFFSLENLQCTQYVLHITLHAWDGDLTDYLTTTQKMCLCLLDIRSNICIHVIFVFFIYFISTQAVCGLIYGSKVAFYSRWPCDGE